MITIRNIDLMHVGIPGTNAEFALEVGVDTDELGYEVVRMPLEVLGQLALGMYKGIIESPDTPAPIAARFQDILNRLGPLPGTPETEPA